MFAVRRMVIKNNQQKSFQVNDRMKKMREVAKKYSERQLNKNNCDVSKMAEDEYHDVMSAKHAFGYCKNIDEKTK